VVSVPVVFGQAVMGGFAAHLARHGAPGHPLELAGHAPLLSDSDELIARRAASEGPVTVSAHPALRANDRSVLREAAIAGMGIAILPGFMGEHSPALVRVLPEWSLGDYVLSMLYLRESRTRTVVRRFAEALSDYLSRHPL
jgi:DNA-binding transcriptional LysR family regulator